MVDKYATNSFIDRILYVAGFVQLGSKKDTMATRKDNIIEIKLKGQVLDRETYLSIPGATIKILGTPCSTVADEEGWYAINGIPFGPNYYFIRADKEGYSNWVGKIEGLEGIIFYARNPKNRKKEDTYEYKKRFEVGFSQKPLS